ncbi:MAG: hypothetical protein IKQ55_01215 [Kiritimatiellae bacterium]|jgi:hypothetical protein|nr:hypothetical protein [Kiritimatiellia bacterium]
MQTSNAGNLSVAPHPTTSPAPLETFFCPFPPFRPGAWDDLTGNPAPAADGYRFFGAAVSLPE